jgi:hypothetical protein
MMLYLREFVGWGYEGNPLLLGLQNDWDSGITWRQETWNKDNAPHFGTAIGSAKFKTFPRDRWCHVAIKYDGRGESTFSVDGEVWGRQAGQAFKPNLDKPLTLSVGPFRGMVDEVRVRTAAE